MKKTLQFILITCLPTFCLTYKTSWVGNSGGTRESYIQNYIWGISVGKSGAVYTVSEWDESGREKGIYKDGKWIGNLAGPGHVSANRAITNDGEYVYAAEAIDRGSFVVRGVGVSRYKLDGSSALFPGGVGFSGAYLEVHATSDDKTPKATALAANGKTHELFYADPIDNTIRVYSTTSLSTIPIATWKLGGIIALATDTIGNIWITKDDGKVYCYSNRGIKLAPLISEIVEPGRIHINEKNELFVIENGPDLQIRIYGNINNTPTLIRTIGDKGGVYSGTRGQIGDTKLMPGMTGVGTDSEGNVYVSSSGVMTSTGSDLRKFSPDGKKLIWRLLGLEFVDNGDFDLSTDGQDLYTRHEHFKLDFNKPTGQEWSYQGYSIDPFKNQKDDHRGDGAVLFRRLAGERFLFQIGMYAGGFQAYRFENKSSEIATPLDALFSNGNIWAWDVDSMGNIWQMNNSQPAEIVKHPFIGLDSNKNLKYGPQVTTLKPMEFDGIERIKYQASNDVMYLSGYSQNHPSKAWGLVGSEIRRYDGWSTGNRKAKYTLVAPVDNSSEKLVPKAMDIAGDYLFLAMCKEPIIHIYNANDGTAVGDLTPGPEVGSEAGWVDIPYGIRAFKKSNGEYLILVEEDMLGKILMYWWCPPGNCVEPSAIHEKNKVNQSKKIQIEFDPLQKGFNINGRHVNHISHFIKVNMPQ